MISALDDVAVLQNHDGVGVPYGRETVGNDEYGPSVHQSVHSLLDKALGTRIDGTRSLIQDQYRRIGYCRPRDGEELSLPL